MTTRKRHRAGSVAWLKELYADLNKEFFENKLPRRLAMEWDTLPGTIIARVKWKSYTHINRNPEGGKTVSTEFKPYVMQFSRRLKHAALQKQAGMSMLHEMAHLKLGVDIDCKDWDGEFDKEMFRIAKAGGFRYFW